MTRIDLDALVGKTDAAEQHEIAFGGETFNVPAQMPAEYVIEVSRFAKEVSSDIEAERAGAVVALATALEGCLGPEGWHRFLLLQPTQEHLMALVNALGELWAGMQVGESAGSESASKRTPGPRKLTSSGSTGSTSEPDSETA